MDRVFSHSSSVSTIISLPTNRNCKGRPTTHCRCTNFSKGYLEFSLPISPSSAIWTLLVHALSPGFGPSSATRTSNMVILSSFSLLATEVVPQPRPSGISTEEWWRRCAQLMRNLAKEIPKFIASPIGLFLHSSVNCQKRRAGTSSVLSIVDLYSLTIFVDADIRLLPLRRCRSG